MTVASVLAVIGVGALAGLDLVSVPQAMIGRPLVAGFLGGAVVGGPLAGLATGAVLELFAFETLPVGASRYPDWGPAAAAAGALAALRGGVWDPAWMAGIMVVALLAAWLGGLGLMLVRRLNAAQIRSREPALGRGDAGALAALVFGGIARDFVRAGILTGVTFAVGERVARHVAAGWRAPRELADVAVLGTALGVALLSAWRLFGQGAARRFLAVGTVAGVALAAGLLAW
ncbi:MAG TPA: PTS sugar transporter subunit IIC [Gemmatimonadales bacterium]|nr:PTS sugar transporter subunit IIC [Gemmatimonadales bacterium]